MNNFKYRIILLCYVAALAFACHDVKDDASDQDGTQESSVDTETLDSGSNDGENLCDLLDPPDDSPGDIIDPDVFGSCEPGGDPIELLSPKLFSGKVTGLYASAKDRSVAVTDAGELATYDGTSWTTRHYSSLNFLGLSGISCFRIYAIARSEQHSFLLLFDGEHLRQLLDTDIYLQRISALDEDHVFLLSTSNKLFRYDGAKLDQLSGPISLEQYSSRPFFSCDESNVVFHAAGDHDIWLSVSGSCQVEKMGLLPNPTSFVVRSTGREWSGVKGAPREIVALGSNSPADILLLDGKGDLETYDGEQFAKPNPIKAAAGKPAFIAGDHQGGFWIGNAKGLLHRNSAEAFTIKNHPPGFVALAPVDGQTVFTASPNGTLGLQAGDDLTLFNQRKVRGEITDIEVANDKTVFLTTDEGRLWQWKADTLTELGHIPVDELNGMALDSHNSVYLGGSVTLTKGTDPFAFVMVYENEAWKTIDLSTPAWPFDRVTSLSPTANGEGVLAVTSLEAAPDSSTPIALVDWEGHWSVYGNTANHPKHITSLADSKTDQMVAAASGRAWWFHDGTWTVIDSGGISVDQVYWPSSSDPVCAVGQGHLLQGDTDSLIPIADCLGDWEPVDLICGDPGQAWVAAERLGPSRVKEVGIIYTTDNICKLLWSEKGDDLSLADFDITSTIYLAGSDFVAVGRDGDHGLAVVSQDKIPKRIEFDSGPVPPLNQVKFVYGDQKWMAVGDSGTQVFHANGKLVTYSDTTMGDLVQLVTRGDDVVFLSNRAGDLYRGTKSGYDKSKSGLGCRAVRDLVYYAADDLVCAVCDSGAAVFIQGGKVIETEMLAPFGFTRVEQFTGGLIAAGRGTEVWSWSLGGWEPIQLPNYIRGSDSSGLDTAASLVVNSPDDFWVAFDHSHLLRYKNGIWDNSRHSREYDLLEGLGDGSFLALSSTTDKISVNYDQDVQVKDLPIPLDTYTAITAANNKSFYLGTQDGTLLHYSCPVGD